MTVVILCCECNDVPGVPHVHSRLSLVHRPGPNEWSGWVPGFIPQQGYEVQAEYEDIHVAIDWKALYREATAA